MTIQSKAVTTPIRSSTELVTRYVTDLKPHPRNSRTHGEAQLSQIAASIKEFTFTNPVLIDEGNVILAGEARWRASTKMGISTVPCIVLAGLTDAQKSAYVIADNKLALNSGWDEEKLRAELERIGDLDLDINLTGFSEVEILEICDAIDADLSGYSPVQDPPGPGTAPNTDDGAYTGMPEFVQPNDKPFRSLIMHFEDQAPVDEFAKLLGQQVTDKTKYLYHPKQVKRSRSEMVYA